MNDRLAFLRAIRANPDNDTARLVFADWLDEHDDPLGAFIRVQIELEPIRDRLEDRRVRELILREEQIERNAARSFGAAFDCEELKQPEFIDYRRGLPESMCVSLDTLLNHGERLLEALPTIRELSVFDIEGRGDQLAACPLLTRLDTLELADRLTAADDRALAVSPHLSTMRRLVLWSEWSSGFGERLAPHLPADWPGRIDVLWLIDGLAVGLGAAECDEPIEPDVSYAQPINEAAGRTVAFDVRPARQLFPLRGWKPDAVTHEDELELGIDSGRGLFYGRLPDGTQAIVATQNGPWYVARFDERGYLLGIEHRPPPFTDWNALTSEDVVARVQADFRLIPAVVRVREFFGPDNFGVHLWSRSMARYLSGGINHNPGSTHRDFGADVCRWLRKRDFVIDWGNDYWADWRGTIHSS